MTLSEWLKAKDVTTSAFAEQIGVKRQSVHRYLEGERLPRRDVLAKIHQATKGAVTANDFLSSQPSEAA